MTDNEDYIVQRFPDWLPRTENNRKAARPMADAITRFEVDISEAEDATAPQKARTIDQLNKLASLLGISRKDGEAKEKFRKRVLLEYRKTTNEGTVKHILYSFALALETDITNVQVSQYQDGTFIVEASEAMIKSSPLTADEIIDFVGDLSAAGFSVDIKQTASFTYIDSETYNNGNFTPSHGYASSTDRDAGGGYAGTL